jgi:CRISPR-associated exonuclease Cas4
MLITGTHIAYLHTCHRKLWLFAHGVHMEHHSDTVAEGKLISETTYLGRARKYTELAVEGIKIDFYDPKRRIVHEVKKSNKLEQAHIAQVKYYLAVLSRKGIEKPSAILEYPKLKRSEEILWDDGILLEVSSWEEKVREIIHSATSPPLVSKAICKSCSYFELCFADEG